MRCYLLHFAAKFESSRLKRQKIMFEELGKWLFATASNCIIDGIVFVLIDIVVKRVIEESSSEEEKRKIWLLEAVLLFAVGLVMYWLYHVPVVLFCLALATLIYTQCLRGVSIREYIRIFMTSWDDHLHFMDNNRIIQLTQRNSDAWNRVSQNLDKKRWDRLLFKHGLLNSNSTPASKPVLQKISELVFRKAPNSQTNNEGVTTDGVMKNGEMFNREMFRSQPVQPVLPQDTGQWYGQNHQQPSSKYSPVLQKPTPQTPTSTTAQLNHSSPTSQQNSVRPTKTSWFGKTELRRRPLHTHRINDHGAANLSGQASNLRSRFMSAFGYGSSSEKPAGIRNEGQNLCFINSILQCLARTPNLPQLLANARKEDMNCSVAESQLLDTLSDILSQCSKSKSSVSVLDTTDFRQCAALLFRQGLVSVPTARQQQQDVAEFYTSLLDIVHTVLNKAVNKGKSSPSSSLSTLKFVYGDFSDEKIEALKTACRREISEADGLNNDSYAEPIQRLADLEWLTYKSKNQTLVDDKFTGQLVSATRCLTDNRLTVSTQAFNILPVPIVTPRDLSGLVYLEDCFTKYCNIERMMGGEGIDCTNCNTANINNVFTPTHPGQYTRKTRNSSNLRSQMNYPLGAVDSGLHSPRISSTSSYMSPIPGGREHLNDSGFHDNVFRTSTPVSDTNFMFPPPLRLRDAERRCLLRQLPECLVIQLMRFTYNQFSQQPRKISVSISIPLKGLDLTSLVFDHVTNRPALTDSEHKYDLYGICVHLGGESTHSGHYVCYCQADNGVWYKFDDDLVWDVNMEYEITTKEIRENAYLLFYKRT